MERGSSDVLRLAHYNINKLADAAEKAHDENRLGLEAEIRDILGRQVFRELELTLGKRMSVNLNLRTQDDLSDTATLMRSMTPAQRAELDRALDLIEQIGKGNVLPATALTSAIMKP